MCAAREYFISGFAAAAAALFPGGVLPHLDTAAAACLRSLDRLGPNAAATQDARAVYDTLALRRIQFRLNRLIIAYRIGRVLPEINNTEAQGLWLFRSLYLLRRDAAPALPGLRQYHDAVRNLDVRDHVRALINYLRLG